MNAKTHFLSQGPSLSSISYWKAHLLFPTRLLYKFSAIILDFSVVENKDVSLR